MLIIAHLNLHLYPLRACKCYYEESARTTSRRVKKHEGNLVPYVHREQNNSRVFVSGRLGFPKHFESLELFFASFKKYFETLEFYFETFKIL